MDILRCLSSLRNLCRRFVEIDVPKLAAIRAPIGLAGMTGTSCTTSVMTSSLMAADALRTLGGGGAGLVLDLPVASVVHLAHASQQPGHSE